VELFEILEEDIGQNLHNGSSKGAKVTSLLHVYSTISSINGDF